MWIKRYRVENFSSFQDSGWIELDQQFNLFVGQNNSGKSALLKALQAPLANNPHKDLTRFRGSELAAPFISVDILIEKDELFRRLAASDVSPTFPARETNAINDMVAIVSASTHFDLQFQMAVSQDLVPRQGASIEIFRNTSNQVVMHLQRQNGALQAVSRAGNPDTLNRVATSDTGSIFHFDAQRLNLARSPLNSQRRLNPNANNLPAVLAHLQGARRPIFDKIERHLMDILPGVERITVVPKDNVFEILVWPDRDARYEELSFNLDDSGTGVGQLLAILTAVVTADQAIMLIDEINSFLHPGAVKRLLSILRSDYGHHQYIISTHSSDTISSCNAEKIYIVRREGFTSSLKPVELNEAADVREVAGTLGFSMMDVFGHDRLIWVEGPTEEQCFPFIARREGMITMPGVGFASVAATDGFAGGAADRRSAIDIYYAAGKRVAPLLRGMAFGLDRERLSDEEVVKAERSKRKLKLLPRRCIECFLINSAAISTILTQLDNKTHDEDAVRAKIIELGGHQKFKAPAQWTGDITSEDWLKRVDGAKLIAESFTELTENRVEFRKTRDCIALLTHIYDNDRASVNGLIDFTGKLVEIALRDTPV